MAGRAGSSADRDLRFLPFFSMAALIIFAGDSRAEDVLLTVNIKKPLAVTSDKFLSYTLDPTVVLTGDALTWVLYIFNINAMLNTLKKYADI